ncbi:MAG: sugar phosphate isomerase/epimerase family protein [Planctomycetota bacterium]
MLTARVARNGTDYRIGVCSWSLRPRDSRSLCAALERVGIGTVQLALGPILDEQPGWTPDAFDELRRAGFEIASGMLAFPGEDYSTLETIRRTGGLRPDERWPASRDRAEAAARLAADHGVGLVTFHAGFLPVDRNDPLRPRMVERLRAVAGLFASRSVAVALETGQETAATLGEVLGDLGRDDVGVNFDPANMILYGMGDPVAALRTLAPAVRQIHVKDASPTEVTGTWGSEVPAGDGAVDWPGFFEVALALDPPLRFIIEREAGDNREPETIQARDLIARHLD